MAGAVSVMRFPRSLLGGKSSERSRWYIAMRATAPSAPKVFHSLTGPASNHPNRTAALFSLASIGALS